MKKRNIQFGIILIIIILSMLEYRWEILPDMDCWLCSGIGGLVIILSGFRSGDAGKTFRSKCNWLFRGLILTTFITLALQSLKATGIFLAWIDADDVMLLVGLFISSLMMIGIPILGIWLMFYLKDN